MNTNQPRVSIGIDAAVVAAHQVAVRGEVREEQQPEPVRGVGTRDRPVERMGAQ